MIATIEYTANIETQGGRFLDCRTFHVPPAKGDRLVAQDGKRYEVLYIDHRTENDAAVVIVAPIQIPHN